MANHDWKIGVHYDYRFGAMMMQAYHNADHSQIFHMRLSDILRDVPRHEVMSALQAADQPATPELDLEEMRRDLIKNTDFKDKVVLDIGGYDGFAAKMALDQGAKRAICLDNHQYEHYGWEDIKKEGVEYVQGDFMQVVPGNQAVWQWVSAGDFYAARPDVIIFYNVLYHLKNPWAALDHLRELINPDGEMLLCTLFRYHDGAWMYVYEERECNPTDISVYFGPSITAIERLLKGTGWTFQQEGLTGDRVCYRCKPDPEFKEHPWTS